MLTMQIPTSGVLEQLENLQPNVQFIYYVGEDLSKCPQIIIDAVKKLCIQKRIRIFQRPVKGSEHVVLHNAKKITVRDFEYIAVGCELTKAP
jgi:hypothetical protein